MKKLASIAVIAAIAIGMTVSATALNDDQQEDGEVDVSIASEVAIDVKPDTLDYNTLDVGSQTTEDSNGQTGVELENIGSEYIDRIWLETTYPEDRPFGTGDSGYYDAGNFVQVKPGDGDLEDNILDGADNWHYVSRYDYVEDQAPTYISAEPSEISGMDNTWVGRFRSGEYNFFYVIASDSQTCNGQDEGSEGAVVRVGNTPHTASTTGTIDFTDDGDDYTEYPIQALGSTGDSPAGQYGIIGGATEGASDALSLTENFDGDGSDETRTYDLLTNCQPNEITADRDGDGSTEDFTPAAHTVRTKYNIDATETTEIPANEGMSSQFMMDSSGTPNLMLYPGDSVTMDTAIEVPQGVQQGDVETGTLTVKVTSNEDPGPYTTGATATSGSALDVDFSEQVTASDASGVTIEWAANDTVVRQNSAISLSNSDTDTETLQYSLSEGLTSGENYEVVYDGSGNIEASDDATSVGSFTEEFTVS